MLGAFCHVRVCGDDVRLAWDGGWTNSGYLQLWRRTFSSVSRGEEKSICLVFGYCSAIV